MESSTAGTRQLAYEIESAVDLDFNHQPTSSGEIESSLSIGVDVPGLALKSRETRHVRVRIRTQLGWTEWSPPLRLEAGLGSPSDWSAVAVGVPSQELGPSPLLRHEFSLRDAPARARLYVTSLGLNDVEINGQRASDTLLAPGWTPYHKRLLVATYDVTGLLTEGPNAIGATLSDGWYRGTLGWEGKSAFYGEELALLAQLELDHYDGTSERIVTGTHWRGSFGSVRASGIYHGSDIDLRAHPAGWSTPGFDDTGWDAAHEVPLDRAILEPQTAPPVRRVADFPMTPLDLPQGAVFDAGQNVSGWVRLVVDGREGQTVTVRHAEVLELDGSLHTRSLRKARATDTYILAADGIQALEPAFTFHGFRFADVVSQARVVSATAIAISSDLPIRGDLETAEPALNQLHANVRWSQRDNFVSVPTDCPQRDERLGWTGDAQAFAATANTLFDSQSFWLSWLRDLELEQAPDGGVASVVPNVLSNESFRVNGEGRDLFGRAGWADAASIVPWSVYESYGDLAPLRQQLISMRRWVDHLDARRGKAPLLPTQFQFGDWLDPDAPSEEPWASKVDSDFVANAFFSRVARIQSWTEHLVGDPLLADHYAAMADMIASAAWSKWGERATTTQTGCALALEFGIAPPEDRHRVGAALAENVRTNRGRISTGFLGTPLVLHALSSAGHIDEAYLMLLCREAPSWLYQVDRGATTVWERWDALRPDGSIHPGNMANHEDAQMLSFNHYAYGSVVDWLYRTVAGLAPDPGAPGYRRIRVAPRPAASVPWARASIETRLGAASIDWSLVSGGALEITLRIPFGAEAVLDLPLTSRSTVSTDLVLEHGTHHIRVTEPAVSGT
ncbi:alpha-L-rhamnosidase [Pseudolysinimonas yzui]|uniref:alpha-L-rhamnosidase n=1 Tax=Pseudolysinimonas yzui TaxID=2708254 RepID=UPI00174CCB04|nr:alpha-L-rhamnosidase [Pseudolysinimonas yzui]